MQISSIDVKESTRLSKLERRKQLEEGIAMNNSSDVDDIVFQKHGLVQEEDPSYTKANFENCSEAEKQGLLELFDKYPGIFGYSRYHCGTFSKWMVSFPTKNDAIVNEFKSVLLLQNISSPSLSGKCLTTRVIFHGLNLS